jgi:cytochrome c oxidase subunit 2
MISQDVLHDLFFPDFRTKQDVLPGRYTTLWFEATKTGTFNIFCAEYCGLMHSGMIGKVHVMKQDDYEAWLSGSTAAGSLGGAGGSGNATSDGEQLFNRLACNTCHLGPDESTGRGPFLHSIYGKEQPLASGETVVVDDDYIRESILVPTAKVAAGFAPVMPTYKGQVNEEQIIQLISYIKSLN